MRLLPAALLASLLAACGHPAAAPQPPPISNHGTPATAGTHEVLATIERTACYGWCPVYTVTVYRDGAMKYHGEDFVKTKGDATGQLDGAHVAQLEQLFIDHHYLDLHDKYTSYDATDAPSTNTSYTVGGKTKRVEHYQGDSHSPPELSVVEDTFDKIIDVEQWIGTEAERDHLFGGGRAPAVP